MSDGTNKEPVKVCCDYCKRPAQLLKDSSMLYHGRNYGPVWYCACQPGGAWVAVHKNSPRFMPLGRLANAELRKAKVAAHAAFDPLWQGKLAHQQHLDPQYKKKWARGDAYQWLTEQLGIDRKDCHIGMFDVETCLRVVEVCAPFNPKIASKERKQAAPKKPDDMPPLGDPSYLNA